MTPPGLPAPVGFDFFLVTAASGAVKPTLRSPDCGCAGLTGACLGAVDVPATFGALAGFGAPEPGETAGATDVVRADGAAAPSALVVESPADEYAGLADDDGGTLGSGATVGSGATLGSGATVGSGAGSPGICQSSHFELDHGDSVDHGLELSDDSDEPDADEPDADEPDAEELLELAEPAADELLDAGELAESSADELKEDTKDLDEGAGEPGEDDEELGEDADDPKDGGLVAKELAGLSFSVLEGPAAGGTVSANLLADRPVLPSPATVLGDPLSGRASLSASLVGLSVTAVAGASAWLALAPLARTAGLDSVALTSVGLTSVGLGSADLDSAGLDSADLDLADTADLGLVTAALDAEAEDRLADPVVVVVAATLGLVVADVCADRP